MRTPSVTVKRKKVTLNLVEDDDSQAFAKWLSYARGVIKFSHIANEEKNMMKRFKNARMGLSAGVPDFVVVTKTNVIWIEMKRKANYKVSKDQLSWIEALTSAGQIALVCHGVEEAMDAVKIVLSKGSSNRT